MMEFSKMKKYLYKMGSKMAFTSASRKKFRSKSKRSDRFRCGKVYDCFTFFNELDLLEIRLNVLNDVVDYFVIVEGDRTHTGNEKDFLVELNRDRFKEFESKIIYVKVDDFPSIEGIGNDEFGRSSAWILERMQRNAIDRGLKSANDNDVILVSDLDEIPRPEYVERYKDIPGVKVFVQENYSAYLNRLNTSEPHWFNGTRMASLRELRELSSDFINMEWVTQDCIGKPQALRFASGTVIYDAGWHFTSLGGVDLICQKLAAFSHQELINEDMKKPEEIERRLAAGEDVFGRDVNFEFVELDNSFPSYLMNQQERYKHLIYEIKGAFKYGLEYKRVKERIEAPETNSSWAFLCNKISESSDVLEFGPSYGYMTRYLKEKKLSRVTIVEYDAECANIASEFAEKTVVADIERSSEWVSPLADDRFDFIVFGDVLEHLRDPKTTILEAIKFLRPGGCLLVSLPNVGHNSVLIDLFNGKFEYRKIGIMDETHLRFFTLDSAKKLIESTGMRVEHVDKVVVPEEETFIRATVDDLPAKIRPFVRDRSDGQVYQYVLTAKLRG
jgi:beta-1,4-mannosyl-glycoprotein beta-1,4-N-acetylglucosaminyltransferase